MNLLKRFTGSELLKNFNNNINEAVSSITRTPTEIAIDKYNTKLKELIKSEVILYNAAFKFITSEGRTYEYDNLDSFLNETIVETTSVRDYVVNMYDSHLALMGRKIGPIESEVIDNQTIILFIFKILTEPVVDYTVFTQGYTVEEVKK